MNFLKKNFGKIFLVTFLAVMPIVSFAQGGVPPGTCDTSGKICNPITTTTIDGFVLKILEGVIKIGMPIVALAIIYSGFLFVSARGNSEKLTKAKDSLLYTVIGAAILLGSWAIAMLISETVLAL